MTHFKNVVCYDFVEDSDCFGEGFGGITWMGGGVAVGEEKEADCSFS